MTVAGDRWWSPWRDVDGTTILHVDLAPDDARERRALALLDEDEAARLGRILSARRRREFVLCRAALRVALRRAARATAERHFDGEQMAARIAGLLTDVVAFRREAT